ncbi:hypothetical protein A3I48_02270 [Candidatus Daviesbacteria bacterium RIFCSPLOWO2_02_FULL_36_7]|uniref:Uncharacterized protein n=1 Tax=Candidatus Daviesbacteria bacterium RIFCSPLOWO2_02_FULL_36_7 TaxID=1797792 RepID=A0A1F5MG91_9BACT|nr:MAG: hypothetical protein A3I48_02270 [Candidatus Daviesbacteria bacterium RIFCSPLOWO2_02_FULL_36_7]
MKVYQIVIKNEPMTTFNLDGEWEFVTTETHHKKFRKNLIKREVLFGLQILLSKAEIKNYLNLKKLYLTEKSEPGYKTPRSC